MRSSEEVTAGIWLPRAPENRVAKGRSRHACGCSGAAAFVVTVQFRVKG